MIKPITTVEMHTGGEPVRIVESGYPELTGATLLDKRRDARENHDHLRTMLMHEPRGHYDMYGVVPVTPDDPGADLAVLFMHNEGYSTMCGHATIAMGRYVVDRGLVPVSEPETTFVLQCPCGPVRVHVAVSDGVAGAARFESVPAFVLRLDASVEVAGVGQVTYDLAFGGAFYAVAEAARFGLSIESSSPAALAAAGTALTQAVAAGAELHHPDGGDLEFLYGSILTDGDVDPSANVCVFADAQIDRSPTGSGVTARMAIRHARGAAQVGDVQRFTSITGSTMTGVVVGSDSWSGLDTVTVEVGGMAYYTGTASFTADPADPLVSGFLVR